MGRGNEEPRKFSRVRLCIAVHTVLPSTCVSAVMETCAVPHVARGALLDSVNENVVCTGVMQNKEGETQKTATSNTMLSGKTLF